MAETFNPSPAMGEEVKPPQYPIESVDNALKLLLQFDERPRIRLTDAATYLGVASSTAHRLLAMLQYRGFVRQEADTRAYVPGPALTAIASAVTRQMDARARARPVLERLNAELRETVSLARLEGTSIHFIDSIESGQAVRVAQRTGITLPAHCSSSGKAALSQLSDDLLSVMYPQEDLPVITASTLSTRTELLRDLDIVRRRGYAISEEESEDGVTGVAVPVPTLGGGQYCLSVAVPIHRATKKLRDEIAGALTGAAEELHGYLA